MESHVPVVLEDSGCESTDIASVVELSGAVVVAVLVAIATAVDIAAVVAARAAASTAGEAVVVVTREDEGFDNSLWIRFLNKLEKELPTNTGKNQL